MKLIGVNILGNFNERPISIGHEFSKLQVGLTIRCIGTTLLDDKMVGRQAARKDTERNGS